MSYKREKPGTLWIVAIIAPCVAIAVLAAGLMAYQRFRAVPKPPMTTLFPSPSDVENIEVSVPPTSYDPEEIGQRSFTLPQEYITPVLAAFTPVVPVNEKLIFRPWDGHAEVFGQMKIKLKSQVQLHLVFYDSGQRPLYLTVNGQNGERGGTYCPNGGISGDHDVGIDESGVLRRVLEEIYYLNRGSKDPKLTGNIKRRLDYLAIARGDRLPPAAGPPADPRIGENKGKTKVGKNKGVRNLFH